MADMVLARCEVDLPDIPHGTEVWVEETPEVLGMVAGGYYSVRDRRAAPGASSKRRSAATPEQPAEEVVEGGDGSA